MGFPRAPDGAEAKVIHAQSANAPGSGAEMFLVRGQGQLPVLLRLRSRRLLQVQARGKDWMSDSASLALAFWALLIVAVFVAWLGAWGFLVGSAVAILYLRTFGKDTL